MADTSRRSPGWTATLQPGLVWVIETSHETAPAGSKYLATERNSFADLPPRLIFRSV